MARQYTTRLLECLWQTSRAADYLGVDVLGGRQEANGNLGKLRETAENPGFITSYLLTLKIMERRLRFGWSKVVGSGSNLVTTDR